MGPPPGLGGGEVWEHPPPSPPFLAAGLDRTADGYLEGATAAHDDGGGGAVFEDRHWALVVQLVKDIAGAWVAGEDIEARFDTRECVFV